MQKYQETVISSIGRPVIGAAVRVTELNGAAATIYSDNGVTPIAALATDATGAFGFYAADGRYTITISGSGFPIRVITDVLLEDPSDGSSVLAAPGGAGLIGFVQAGSGTSARTVQAKLRDVVCIKDYAGILGDGSHDDTAGINAATASLSAIAKAAGTVVRVTFPDGVYMMDSLHLQGNIWYDLGNAEIRRIANAGAGTSGYNDASLVRAIEFSSPGLYPGYGRYDKIRISGGFLNGNGKTFGSHLMRALFCRDMIVENLTILARGASTQFAFVVGGRDIDIRNFRCLDAGLDGVGDDGLHILHGQNIRVNGIHVKSGDDALAIGGEPSEASLAANPEGISDVVASNINVYSSHGNAVKVYSVAGSAWNTVTRVRVHGVVGASGVLRNGGVAVRDDNNTAAGTSQISDVQVTGVSLALGSASHDGTQPYGTYIKSSSSVKVEAAYSITASGVGQNFTAERIEKSFDVQADTKVAAYPVRGATYIDSCDLVRSRHSGETVTGTLLQPFGTVLNTTRLTFNDTDWSLNYTSAGGNAGISLTDSDVSFENVKVRGARSAQNIIQLVGTANVLNVRGGKLAHVAGATSGNAIDGASSTFTYMGVRGCDFSQAFQAFPASSIAGGAAYDIVSNRGAPTMARGLATVTSGNTSIDVTPTLAVAMSDINQVQISPRNSDAASKGGSLANVSGTVFRINLNSAAAVGGAQFNYVVNTSQK